jgi:aspartyl-tRNA(Asn)/glutamyl-tRNA(Gln) amidotransferase subunit A
MSETDLARLPATELAALVRSRRVSPIEIVDAVLARIEAVEPRLVHRQMI